MKVIPTKEYKNAFLQLSEKEINLDILEPLDIVKLRNGTILFVTYNLNDTKYRKGFFCFDKFGCKSYFCRYNNDLTHEINSDEDIVAISRSDLSYSYLEHMFSDKYNNAQLDDLVSTYKWKEINQNHKEMTIEEIEKILGYKIKIVDNQ